MTPFLRALVLLTLARAAVCEAGSLAALFPKEADIHVSRPGLARLDLPEEEPAERRRFSRRGGKLE